MMERLRRGKRKPQQTKDSMHASRPQSPHKLTKSHEPDSQTLTDAQGAIRLSASPYDGRKTYRLRSIDPWFRGSSSRVSDKEPSEAESLGSDIGASSAERSPCPGRDRSVTEHTVDRAQGDQRVVIRTFHGSSRFWPEELAGER